VTPGAVTGPVTGGQFCAHVPLQFDVVDVSGANEYSVKPLLLVNTVAPPIVVVFSVLAPAAAELLLPDDEGDDEGVGEAPAELHATRAVAATAAAGSARSIRRRVRPGIFRVVMSFVLSSLRFSWVISINDEHATVC
jgi:hypothetical protein